MTFFSENRRGFKAFRTDTLPNGSVELLWLHKMMCPYKRTHLSYTATNFCNLGFGNRWQGSQTDSVKWQLEQVTILVHHPSTSFPNLYNSCFTWGYCHSFSVLVNCYLTFSFDVTRVLRVAVICKMAFKTDEPWQNSCNFWHHIITQTTAKSGSMWSKLSFKTLISKSCHKLFPSLRN